MIQPLKYLPVNWTDGMKISRQHFIAEANHHADSLRDVASYTINKNNFGLLPITNTEGNNSIFDVYNSATNDVQLLVKRCHALTPAGFRISVNDISININSLNAPNDVAGGTASNESYYILISVNPFEQVPGGEFDPEETPPRHLFTTPKYHIEMVPVNTVNMQATSGNYIIAGRVLYKNGIVTADEHFIPACTSVSSHPQLMKYYNSFAGTISSLQQFAIRIIQKNQYKNQNAALTICIKQLCNIMLQQFAGCYFYYRNVIHQLSPVYMVEMFASFAHAIYNGIEIIGEKEKEEMLNYCYEWSDIAPHQLLNQLSAVVEINYDHYNNGEHLRLVSTCLNSLVSIWEKLSSLEYIGQHKENIIVKEEALTQTVKDKKGWSILD